MGGGGNAKGVAGADIGCLVDVLVLAGVAVVVVVVVVVAVVVVVVWFSIFCCSISFSIHTWSLGFDLHRISMLQTLQVHIVSLSSTLLSNSLAMLLE